MKLALYTTIYPGCERFLEEWKQSIIHQNDRDFDVWVGVDGFSYSEAEKLLFGINPKKTVINDQPYKKAYIRRKVLNEVINLYDAVVFVDSDDVLRDSRISSTRKYLEQHDVIGCAMNMIDFQGIDLGVRFGRQRSGFLLEDIIRYNQFGLSNTAYRTSILKDCLTMSDECELFDWYLITAAWSVDANIYFDPIERMSYRQYSENSTKVLLPFTAEDIQKATEKVLEHFSFVLTNGKTLKSIQKNIIEKQKERVEKFNHEIFKNQSLMENYVEAFNKLTQDTLWWSCVANDHLEVIWNR